MYCTNWFTKRTCKNFNEKNDICVIFTFRKNDQHFNECYNIIRTLFPIDNTEISIYENKAIYSISFCNKSIDIANALEDELLEYIDSKTLEYGDIITSYTTMLG